jgi:nucleotide-binding universal stress UspA family protein
MAEDLPKNAVLVGVDFSEHARAALLYAAEMAACLKAPLVILHVVHDPGEEPGYYAKAIKKKGLQKMEDVAQEMLTEFVDKAAAEHEDLKALGKAHRLLVVGLPVARLLETADKLKPRMVVLGSQGRTGLSHLLLGSKAEQVVRLCAAPVTIVKVKKK